MPEADFAHTGTILDKILQNKVIEVAERKKYIALSELAAYVQQVNIEDPPRDFAAALRREPEVALIAEIKRASPSRGVMVENFDPLHIGLTYAQNGAAAISVLTDPAFFHGDLKHLFDVRHAVDLPVLCKDFVIDPYQVYAARSAGADAVLLIVAALSDERLAELNALIETLGMVALVEVHDEAELARALRITPRVIGINNRDLKTFDVELETTGRLAQAVPEHVVLVAESGIKTDVDVQHMGRLGAHAVLVGETLVTAPDMPAAVRALSGQKRARS